MTAEPGRIISLGEGAENRFEGEWPNRVLKVVTRPELHIYGVASPKARAVVCAGGGYTSLVHDKEGVEVALWLNKLGYEACVLVHRLPGQSDGRGGVWPKDIALTDGLAALDFLAGAEGDHSKHAAGDLPLVWVGLSSGGHMAGVMACQSHVRAPSALIVAYGPVNANHRDYKAPAGKPDYPPVEKQAFYNDWPIGITAEPMGVPKCPVFLAYALHDTSVPVDHALNFIRTGRDLALDLDAHVFGLAPHGFALRDLDGSQADWPGLAERWLARKLGQT